MIRSQTQLSLWNERTEHFQLTSMQCTKRLKNIQFTQEYLSLLGCCFPPIQISCSKLLFSKTDQYGTKKELAKLNSLLDIISNTD